MGRKTNFVEAVKYLYTYPIQEIVKGHNNVSLNP